MAEKFGVDNKNISIVDSNTNNVKSSFFGSGGKDAGKPSNRSKLFKTCHSQPQNGGLGADERDRLKLKRGWGSWNGDAGEKAEEEEKMKEASDRKMDDEILADYGGDDSLKEKQTPGKRSSANAASMREKISLFAKGPPKRKMGWSVNGDCQEDDYENGHLFKRAKTGTEVCVEETKRLKNEDEGVDASFSSLSQHASESVSKTPSSPLPSHSISPSPPPSTSTPPTSDPSSLP